jgi:hypothetical protein
MLVFLVLRYVPYIPGFFIAFIMKRCWIFVKCFFYIYWNDCAIFVFDSVYVLYYDYQSAYVEPSWCPWNESNSAMVFDLFIVLLDSVSMYFIENICIYVHQGNWSVISFCCCVFVWFWCQGHTGFMDLVIFLPYFME